MKSIIVMMVLSLVYLVAMNVINKKISTLDFSAPQVEYKDSSNASYFEVSISGAVNNPGTYTVNNGATLAYLITLAGGVKENADTSAYNLNLVLTNKANYYIAAFSSEGEEKVSINEATIALLDTLPGIGSVLAKRIVSYRSSNGNFNSLEEIKNVSGIGDSLFEQIKDLICL